MQIPNAPIEPESQRPDAALKTAALHLHVNFQTSAKRLPRNGASAVLAALLLKFALNEILDQRLEQIFREQVAELRFDSLENFLSQGINRP